MTYVNGEVNITISPVAGSVVVEGLAGIRGPKGETGDITPELQAALDSALEAEANAIEQAGIATTQAGQAADDAEATAADRIQTGLDAIDTAADRAQTALDAQTTAADRVQTGLDAIATAADRVQTGLDTIATAADRVQTGLDAGATGDDRAQTALDVIATGADRVQTGLDAIATAADRVQTGLDAIATAGDRVQTGIDAQTATEQAGIATGAAEAAAASESATLNFGAELSVSISTLEPTDDATIDYDPEAISIAFGIPRGADGAEGLPGTPGADAPTYERRHAWQSPYSYCGKALSGTAESSAIWTLTRIQIASDGTTTTTHATDSWDNRLTATYT